MQSKVHTQPRDSSTARGSGGSIRRKESDATTFKAEASCSLSPRAKRPTDLTSNWRFEIGARGGQIEFLSSGNEKEDELYGVGQKSGP